MQLLVPVPCRSRTSRLAAGAALVAVLVICRLEGVIDTQHTLHVEPLAAEHADGAFLVRAWTAILLTVAGYAIISDVVSEMDDLEFAVAAR